jgi:hypothetical protein
MPLLEITNSRKVTTTVSLEESTANLVNQYAAFTSVAADDVLPEIHGDIERCQTDPSIAYQAQR